MPPVRDAFGAVGTSQPVHLTREQELQLLHCIDLWSKQSTDGWDARSRSYAVTVDAPAVRASAVAAMMANSFV